MNIILQIQFICVTLYYFKPKLNKNNFQLNNKRCCQNINQHNYFYSTKTNCLDLIFFTILFYTLWVKILIKKFSLFLLFYIPITI